MRSSLRARMLGAAFGVGAVFGGVALAQDEAASPITISGNVAISSDYVFRGLSQTSNSFAVSGGFDASYGIFYAGTWASSLDFGDTLLPGVPNAPIEIDGYVGITPTLGPISLDLGFVGYFYPNARDDAGGAGEYDYYELYANGSISPTEAVTLGTAFAYSPEFFGDTGDAYYVEGNASLTLTDYLSVSGAVGYQYIDDLSGLANAGPSGDYVTWNLGATFSMWGLDFDARYVDTSIDATNPFITNAFTSLPNSKERGVFTISKSL